ncbi:MAG: hypothetical protein CL555_20695 [Algoriphagus sp.]|nr:hypothetical protein [Algoriphagus sp.]|tara:strand:+ start:514 stop:978 length:465 start_codon:yes stop_codon:yes gene_type:complete
MVGASAGERLWVDLIDSVPYGDKVVIVLGQIAAVTGPTANASSWKTFLRLIVVAWVIVVALPLQASHAPLHGPTAETHLTAIEWSADPQIEKAGTFGAGQHDNTDHVHETPIIVNARWASPPDWPRSWKHSHVRTQIADRPAPIDQPPRPEQSA